MNLKFFTDSHIPKQVAIQLRRTNITVVRCQDVGLADAGDEELLDYAIANKYTMLTKDDDFLVLHGQWREEGRDHFGIFYCPHRDKKSIGLIVTICREYHDLLSDQAATIDDIKNEIVHIT